MVSSSSLACPGPSTQLSPLSLEMCESSPLAAADRVIPRLNVTHLPKRPIGSRVALLARISNQLASRMIW
jgi:hypothetical protein